MWGIWYMETPTATAGDQPGMRAAPPLFEIGTVERTKNCSSVSMRVSRHDREAHCCGES